MPRFRLPLSLSAALVASAFVTPDASARPLQIIYTNDIHALYETSENGRGGLAQIKAVIDRIRARAQAQNIETLVTDSGDFTDGSIYRFVDEGAGPLRMLDRMGYDATVLGNHDWLMGADLLNELFARTNPQTPFLTANFRIKKEHEALQRHFKPYLQLEKAGVKIALLGLTTNAFVYEWLVQEGKMVSSARTAAKWVPRLKKDNDYVFLLSHMGFSKDKEVASNVPYVDLVIGGHSHTYLPQPAFVTNPDGRKVPIVQTGAHGEFVGDLLVDVEKGKPLKVLHGELVEVRTDGPQDPVIAEAIRKDHDQLEKQYGPGWLDEVVATSELPMIHPEKSATPWGNIYAEAIREAADADLSLDFSMFYGSNQPAGPVTRAMLFDFYPRTYATDKPFGWTIWKVKVPGWLLETVISATLEFGAFVGTSGVTYKVHHLGKLKWFSGFRVNGKRVIPFRNYEVAISEGVGRGTDEISKLLRSLFRPKDTGIPVWQAVETKVRALGNIAGPKPATP